MRLRYAPLVLLMVVLAGCPSQNVNPPTTQQVRNVAVDNSALTLDTAVKELTAAKKAGLIRRGSDLDKRISLALHSANDALNAYYSGTASGQSDFAAAAGAFWAVYAEVEPQIVKGK